MDTLPSGCLSTVVHELRSIPWLSPPFPASCPFRAHLIRCYPGQRGVTPAFGYGAPYPGASGTSTHLIWALPSTHYGPFRHPIAPSLTVTGLRLVATTDHTIGLPVLRAFPLCACCRHYPGTATGDTASLITPPALSAFPALADGSACATSFSRIAQRSLTLRPAHSPSHLVTLYIRGFSHFVTSMTAPIASGWSNIAGWDSHPLRNAAFARRTPEPVIPGKLSNGRSAATVAVHAQQCVLTLSAINCHSPKRSERQVC